MHEILLKVNFEGILDILDFSVFDSKVCILFPLILIKTSAFKYVNMTLKLIGESYSCSGTKLINTKMLLGLELL